MSNSIGMGQERNCIFCKIVSKQIPAHLIAENEGAVAILDISPLTQGHTLVLPRSHAVKIQDTSLQDLEMVFKLVRDVAFAIEQALDGVESSLISIHNGQKAGQEIPHMHVHVIPRRLNDGGAAVHTIFKSRPQLGLQEMESIAKKISSSIKRPED